MPEQELNLLNLATAAVAQFCAWPSQVMRRDVQQSRFLAELSTTYRPSNAFTGIGFWPAAIVNSLIFAAIHMTNGGESAVGILSLLSVALFSCFTLWWTGMLWFAVGFHAVWDYGETLIYGVSG